MPVFIKLSVKDKSRDFIRHVFTLSVNYGLTLIANESHIQALYLNERVAAVFSHYQVYIITVFSRTFYYGK